MIPFATKNSLSSYCIKGQSVRDTIVNLLRLGVKFLQACIWYMISYIL